MLHRWEKEKVEQGTLGEGTLGEGTLYGLFCGDGAEIRDSRGRLAAGRWHYASSLPGVPEAGMAMVAGRG